MLHFHLKKCWKISGIFFANKNLDKINLSSTTTHGFVSLWQPLCRKYRVWSGNSIPQYKHCKFFLLELEAAIISLSAPVDVIVPFVDVATTGASGITVKVLKLLLELQTLVEELSWVAKWFKFRATRLLARAVMRRFRSSRNRDFSGET